MTFSLLLKFTGNSGFSDSSLIESSFDGFVGSCKFGYEVVKSDWSVKNCTTGKTANLFLVYEGLSNGTDLVSGSCKMYVFDSLNFKTGVVDGNVSFAGKYWHDASKAVWTTCNDLQILNITTDSPDLNSQTAPIPSSVTQASNTTSSPSKLINPTTQKTLSNAAHTADESVPLFGIIAISVIVALLLYLFWQRGYFRKTLKYLGNFRAVK